MRGRVGALMTEMAFVLTSVAVLKEGLFPFLIEHWFTDAEMVSAQLERTAILAGGVTALLYLGLGSAASLNLTPGSPPRFFVQNSWSRTTSESGIGSRDAEAAKNRPRAGR